MNGMITMIQPAVLTLSLNRVIWYIHIINKLHLIIWALIYVDQLTVCPFVSAVIFSKSHEAMI